MVQGLFRLHWLHPSPIPGTILLISTYVGDVAILDFISAVCKYIKRDFTHDQRLSVSFHLIYWVMNFNVGF